MIVPFRADNSQPTDMVVVILLEDAPNMIGSHTNDSTFVLPTACNPVFSFTSVNRA